MRWFLPVLFVTYLASYTCFAHVHIVNGVTIVHSHPFQKGGEHEHTVLELWLIDFLSHLTSDGMTVLTALPLFIPYLLRQLLSSPSPAAFLYPYHGVAALRAPPSVSIFSC